jgi:hypothetical protein
LFVMSRFEALEPLVALLLAGAVPAVALFAVALPMRDASRPLRILATLVLIASAIFAGRELWGVFGPADVLATAELSREHPDADLGAPSELRAFELEVHGHLLDPVGAATGQYRLDVSRGSSQRRVTGELARTIRAGRVGRRGPPVQSVTTHEARRQPIEMAGAGPVHVHLRSLDRLEDRLEVALLDAPIVGLPLWVALGILVALALAVEAWAARERIKARWTAAVAVSGVLAVSLVERFDPDDPLTTVIGALLLAGLTGGLGGSLAGIVATHFAQPRAHRGTHG